MLKGKKYTQTSVGTRCSYVNLSSPHNLLYVVYSNTANNWRHTVYKARNVYFAEWYHEEFDRF